MPTIGYVSRRICLVTPFDWSKPNDVNEYVAAAAAALRALGHGVTILGPSSRATQLAAGRRALRKVARTGGVLDGFVALGPALPLPARSGVGMPVGARANLRLALARGQFDVVHAYEPALAGFSYLALREARGISVATFHDPERLSYPPGKAQRLRLLARIDALTATSPRAVQAANARFPGDYLMLPSGIDTDAFTPGQPRNRFVIDWNPEARPLGKAAVRALRELPGFELIVLRPPLAGRPYVPRDLRDRVSIMTAADAGSRAAALSGACALISATGRPRVQLEAATAGVPTLTLEPELLATAMHRLAHDEAFRAEEAEAARKRAASESCAELGRALDTLYNRLIGRRRSRPANDDPLADRPWILVDLHMHTEHSHDCAVPVADLLDYAEAIGLGAIAITDHNVFAGAEDALERSRGRDLIVIPGEEIKTDGQGEVIGLFLKEQIPRGMSMAGTIAAIRDQGGLVYLPHPFDRLHAIPDAATLHRHLPDIDVLEAFNARLLFDGFNDEALRFGRKYNLLMAAGSDAHVLQGVGTGAMRLRAFDGPEELLLSLRTAEIVRRPKSLLYLQGLKWVAQARERRGRPVVR
jgi:predicted metal-dependent phosphoesterase TrpH/glycosyltransferase involved in cell wall biosynthesis